MPPIKPITVVERHSDVYPDSEYQIVGKFHKGKTRTTEVLTSKLYPVVGDTERLGLSCGVKAIDLVDNRTYPVTSQLYGHVVPEQVSVAASTISINLRFSATPSDKISHSFGITAIDLRNIVQVLNQPNDDKLSHSFGITAINLTTVVRNHSQPGDDKISHSFAITAIDVKTVVVNHPQPNNDKISHSFGVTAISLV